MLNTEELNRLMKVRKARFFTHQRVINLIVKEKREAKNYYMVPALLYVQRIFVMIKLRLKMFKLLGRIDR